MIPRGLAVQVLTAVFADGVPLDQALDRISSERKLDSQSRAWLLDVTAGVMRWRGRLDLALDSAALKKKPSGWLRKILLVGAYQILAQERVAAPVVVSETVSEIKRKEGQAPAKFANAILRKIADTAHEWRDLPFPQKATDLEQAQWASLPEWFWKKLLAQRGLEWSKAFALASLQRPTLWFRVAQDWKPVANAKTGPVPGSYCSDVGGDVSGWPGFSEGSFFVQDISSQFLIHEVSDQVKAISHKENLSALDLCAAPGGKSLGLAWSGFQVVATDIDQARLALLSQNLSRVRADVRIIPKNEVSELEPRELVWVDAPCTGSGIIRRHPDVRWLRKERDLETLAQRQADLVQEGWGKVAGGGFLVYSVCSVFREEGSEVLTRCGLGSKILKEWLLAPHESPYGDGFWAALLRK